jgi:hypothetical protein
MYKHYLLLHYADADDVNAGKKREKISLNFFNQISQKNEN